VSEHIPARQSLARAGDRTTNGSGRGITVRDRVSIDRVRHMGRNALGAVMRSWIAGLDHVCENPDHDCLEYRLKCAREIADRCGLPRMKELKASVEIREVPLLAFPFGDPFPERVEAQVVDVEADKPNESENRSFPTRAPEQLEAGAIEGVGGRKSLSDPTPVETQQHREASPASVEDAK